MTEPSDQLLPSKTKADQIVSELTQDPAGGWRPASLDEWIATHRLRTVLDVWSKELGHERSLRERVARWVFGLLTAEIAAVIGIVVVQGKGILTLDVELLKWLVGGLFGEVFGMGWVIIRYLFPSRGIADWKSIFEKAPNGN